MAHRKRKYHKLVGFRKKRPTRPRKRRTRTRKQYKRRHKAGKKVKLLFRYR